MEKNRFSKLLEQLMTEAEVKNNSLAREVGYDVSYISKWVSGRLIPGEKTYKKVLHGISHCVVYNSTVRGLENLKDEYHLESNEFLEQAIYDHLKAEYEYVKDQEKNEERVSDTKTVFYPTLSMTQFIEKMHHPVLRRVKSLNIVSMIDLGCLSYDNRLQFLGMNNDRYSSQRHYPDVHFHLIVNDESTTEARITDTVFMLRMLVNEMHIDFNVYRSKKASGRAMFAVEDDFLITGMLDDFNMCTSVVVSENPAHCNEIYTHMKSQLNDSDMLFRPVVMDDIFGDYNYMYALMAGNQSWLVGHITEYFFSDELFESLVVKLMKEYPETKGFEENMRNIHKIYTSILKTSEIRLLLCDSVFSNLAFTDEVDFFGYRVKVTADEKIAILQYFRSMIHEYDNLDFRMVLGKFDDSTYIANQSIFLSDRSSYLRLNNNSGQSQMYVAEQTDMHQMLKNTFENIWEDKNKYINTVKALMEEHITQVIKVISTEK